MNKDFDLDNEFVARPKERGGYRMLLLLISLFALTLLSLYAYRAFLPDEETYNIPIIEADDDVIKIKPLDPGGSKMSHMDKDVYDTIAKYTESHHVERLLSGPEAPIFNKENFDFIEGDIVTTKPLEENKVSTELIQINSDNSTQKSLKNIVQERENIKKSSDTQYKIQLASMKSRELAQKEWGRLSAKHKIIFGSTPYFIEKKDLADRGVYYCIQVGAFKKYSAAHNMCKKLLAKNQNCIILEN